MQFVLAGGCRVIRLAQTDLFRADADREPTTIVDQAPGSPDPRIVGQADRGVLVVRPLDRARQQVAHPKETGHEPGRRPLVQAFGVAQLFVAALVHDGDPVRHRHRLLLVVGHVDEGDAHFLLDALELHLHLAAEFEVQGAQRFVQEEDGRAIDERSRQRHPLGLTAGDLGRLAAFVAGQLHELEHLRDPTLDLRVPDLLAAQAERDVLVDAQVREERIALEDRVDVALVGRQPGHVLALQFDHAGRGLLKTADHPEGRGLAAAGRAKQTEELAVVDFQVDVVHSHGVAESLGHIHESDVDDGHVRAHSCVRWVGGSRGRNGCRRTVLHGRRRNRTIATSGGGEDMGAGMRVSRTRVTCPVTPCPFEIRSIPAAVVPVSKRYVARSWEHRSTMT